MYTLKINNLCKSYGKTMALNDFSFEFENGIYGILGRNGAGKTTLFRVIVGMLEASSGDYQLYKDDNKIPQKEEGRYIGYLPQEFDMYRYYSVQEMMEELCLIRGIKKKEIKNEIKKLLGLVNLVDARKKKIGALSGGMKRRLGLAQAMIGSPALLIVDEPTAGVDPEERVKIRQLLSDYAMNHIVLMSTHIVEDIAHICEKVIIQEKGRTRFKGDIKDLINEATEHLGEKYFPSLKEFQEYAKENDVISFYRAGQDVRAIIKSESGKLKSEIGLEDAYMWSIKG